jgi:GAF domain-containing protein
MVPDRGSLTCRAILDGTTIHIRDLAAEPGISFAVRALGHKTQVTIPLMREGKAIGAITTSSFQVDGVTDTQIDLLKTFAEQAVIAITSAETYRALQGRTADLQESLEQQTATAEVLAVINASPGDPKPVFHTILDKAHQVCGVSIGSLQLFDGTHFHTVATKGLSERH